MSFISLEKFNKQFEKGSPRTVSNILQGESDGNFRFFIPTPENIDTSVLIDRIEKALPRLAEVVYAPYIVLKSEYKQVRTELASNLTPQGIQMTVKDAKLWKKKDGKLRPEYVYAKSNEDEYDIYENRVVFALIDKLLQALELPAVDAREGVKNMYGAYFQSAVLNKLDLVKLIDPDIFKSSNMDSFSDFKKIVYLRGKLLRLRNSAFYKIMAQAPRFSGVPESTNLFVHNENYRECFLLWRFLDEYRSGRTVLTHDELQSVYRAFVSLFMVSVYVKSGFKIVNDNTVELADKDFALKDLVLENKYFKIIINAEADKIDILVRCEKSKSQQKTYVLLHTDESEPYIKNDGFIVSLFKTEYRDNAACVLPHNKNSLKDLESIVRCTVLTFEADKEIYDKVCPICGSNALHDKDYYYRCEDCGAVYSFPDAQTVWLNRFNILSEQDKKLP